MTKDEIKIELLNNISKIEEILSSLGCHSIKIRNKRISCALPDGDNPSSIQVMLDESLAVFINTRHDFPKNADIFSLVGYFNNTDFPTSLRWVSNFLGVQITKTHVERNFLVDLLNPFFDSGEEFEVDENTIIPESILSEYVQLPHKFLSEDGIFPEVQNYFGICYDVQDSRILIPIRDMDGNLISVKGRTTISNYKELKIPKYLSYYNYRGSSTLYGYSENINDIKGKGEVIIVEAEKGVMQALSMGFGNCLALSKSKISDEQVDAIIKLQCDIVFALDKDVSYEDVYEQAKPFIGIANVYIIIDDMDLLDDKDSPFDKGDDTWFLLYNRRKRVEYAV